MNEHAENINFGTYSLRFSVLASTLQPTVDIHASTELQKLYARTKCVLDQLMIILLRNSAFSGKYSSSSSLVTQTKSSHFLMLNLLVAITWDLKKNCWKGETKCQSLIFDNRNHREHRCWYLSAEASGRQKKKRFTKAYLNRWRVWHILCWLCSDMAHGGISNKICVWQISQDRF